MRKQKDIVRVPHASKRLVLILIGRLTLHPIDLERGKDLFALVTAIAQWQRVESEKLDADWLDFPHFQVVSD